MRSLEDAPTGEQFRVTGGFIAFVAALCLPGIVALAVFFGAWLVADEVRAAEAARSVDAAAFTSEHQDVPGWKKALVGVCPAH